MAETKIATIEVSNIPAAPLPMFSSRALTARMPVCPVAPVAERDDRAGYDTDEQHDKDVDTDDAADEHEHIGDDLNEIVGRDGRGVHVRVQRQHEDECERRERGGKAMWKFSRNLSFIAQPCPLQAAMVVSEMKLRLSPNIAPPMTDATHSGRE